MPCKTALAATLVLVPLVLWLPFRFGSALVVLAFVASAAYTWHNAGRGRGPANGRAIAVTAGLWGLGHLVELFTRVDPGWTATFAPADLLFALLLPSTFFVSLLVFNTESGGVNGAATARLTLDALLVATSALSWHLLLVWSRVPDDTPTFMTVYSLFFVGCLALSFAAQFFAAVQVADRARIWMAASTFTLTVAVSVWSLGIVVAPHTQRIGPALLVLGVGLLAAASASPASPAQDDLLDGASHELVSPMMLAALTAAVSAVPALASTAPLRTVPLVGMLVLMAARILVVRSSAQALTRRLRGYAYTDPLTGVGNRRSLQTRIGPMTGWLLSIDLDRFKEINDRQGHEFGDQLLVRFTRRASALRPPTGHLARTGGDEFVLALPNATLPEARRVAAAVVRAGADPRLPGTSASVGVSPVLGEDDAETALRNADIALQVAKRRGGNRFAVLDGQMIEDRLRELAIAQALHADAVDQIRLAYQPVVRIDRPDRPTVVVEALARWDSPELGPVPPAEFIEIAERNGTIGRVGLRVLALALEQLQSWHDDGFPLYLSVNVSWAQLRDPKTVDEMATMLTMAGPVCRHLVLEATESLFATDQEAVAAAARLRALGPRIAMDDFGVGGSTLTRLRSLPVDILKLDRALLADIGDDPRAEVVLKSVAALSQDLRLLTIAEGVEDEALAERIQALGLRFAQGFLFSRPTQADTIRQRAHAVIDLAAAESRVTPDS